MDSALSAGKMPGCFQSHINAAKDHSESLLSELVNEIFSLSVEERTLLLAEWRTFQKTRNNQIVT